ncbi:MAG: hypothetical protein WAO55_07005 [Candidatus Manganitrophaceae bacterium]
MMMTKNIWTHLVFLLSVMFILAGCGGGGGGTGPGPVAGSGDFVKLEKFSLAPARLNVGPGLMDKTAFVIDWEASWSSPSNIYVFEVHFTKDAAALSKDTLAFSLNCPLHPACNKVANAGSLACDYRPFSNNPTVGVASVVCQGAVKTVAREGAAFSVVRACIWNSKMEYICSDGTQEVTLG